MRSYGATDAHSQLVPRLDWSDGGPPRTRPKKCAVSDAEQALSEAVMPKLEGKFRSFQCYSFQDIFNKVGKIRLVLAQGFVSEHPQRVN